MEELGGKVFDDKECEAWCGKIVDEIQSRVASECTLGYMWNSPRLPCELRGRIGVNGIDLDSRLQKVP
jgi:hypothetical protein